MGDAKVCQVKLQRGSGDWDTAGKELVFTSAPLWMTVLQISKTASLPGFQIYFVQGTGETRESRMTPSTIWGSPHHLPFDSNKVKGSS